MPPKSKLKLKPLDLGGKTLGERIADIRKQKGHTQAEVAKKIGLIQNLVSSYETGRLRLTAEMAIRFARALGVTTDELFMLKKPKGSNGYTPGLHMVKRMKRIDALPGSARKTLLRTIDAFLESSEK